MDIITNLLLPGNRFDSIDAVALLFRDSSRYLASVK